MRIFQSLLAGWVVGGAIWLSAYLDHRDRQMIWLAPVGAFAVTLIAMRVLKRS